MTRQSPGRFVSLKVFLLFCVFGCVRVFGCGRGFALVVLLLMFLIMFVPISNLRLLLIPLPGAQQLVIGGLNRVFEIGKVFRNEDIDTTHNPEFTSCEFYQAYAGYADLMALTEELLPQIAAAVNAKLRSHNGDAAGTDADLPATSTRVTQLQLPRGARPEADGSLLIDWRGPYHRIDVMEELERIVGQPLPDPNDPGMCVRALMARGMLWFQVLDLFGCSGTVASPSTSPDFRL